MKHTIRKTVTLLSVISACALSAAIAACGGSSAPPHEHSYETALTPPTCTEKGYTTYTCACGDTYRGDFIDATGHRYEESVTPPTCTEKGYTTYTCTCGDTYRDDFTDATGHAFSETLLFDRANHWCACSVCGEKKEVQPHESEHYVCACGHEFETKGLNFKLKTDGSYSVSGYNGTETEIYIPSKHDGKAVTEISRGAFSSSAVTKVTVANGITKIGNEAFFACNALTEIKVPDAVETIGNLAFSSCGGLRTVAVGAGVRTIGEQAFTSCPALATITVSAENEAFTAVGNCLIAAATKTLIAGCKTSKIPTDGSVTAIGARAFSGCVDLTSIVIPDCVTEIAASAFEDCTGLAEIAIGRGVAKIGSHAFYHCTALKRVIYGGTQAEWDAIKIGSNNSALTNAER